MKCPNNAQTEKGYYCNDCRLRDDFFLCVQCDGSECINKKRREECKKENYYLYLAAFDSLVKVGISMEFRVMERFVEQGADMAAKAGVVTDGKLARSLEQDVKRSLGIADRVTGDRKHDLIFGSPNRAAASLFDAISRLKETAFAPYMIYPEIHDLRKHYRLSTVHSRPEKFVVKEGSALSGRVVAAKGNIIVIENSGFFSVNAHDLIGREMELEIS